MIAAAVSFARVIIEISLVSPRSLHVVGPPLLIQLLWIAALAAAVWLLGQKDHVQLQEPENPAELKSALVFGALFAIIIFAVAAIKRYLGDRALYAAAVISGLTDMDAITLSTSQLINDGRLTAQMAWRMILVAAMSNTLFKAFIVMTMGNRALALRLGVLFSAAIVGGGLLLLFWPDEKIAHWLRSIVPATQQAIDR